MQYAFNMLIKAWMYMKVYDECVCVYNWRGYLSQHCKPSITEGKNISVQKTSTSLVSHLFSSLQSHPNAYDLRYLKIKWATIIIWQREMEEWKKIWHLRMAENDVSMKIFDAAAIVHIWSEPSKLQTFNNT